MCTYEKKLLKLVKTAVKKCNNIIKFVQRSVTTTGDDEKVLVCLGVFFIRYYKRYIFYNYLTLSKFVSNVKNFYKTL